MSDAATLKLKVRDLIDRMDAVTKLDDDLFVAFADEVDPLLKELKSAVASDPQDHELKQLMSMLRASFAKLSSQLSFCTLG